MVTRVDVQNMVEGNVNLSSLGISIRDTAMVCLKLSMVIILVSIICHFFDAPLTVVVGLLLLSLFSALLALVAAFIVYCVYRHPQRCRCCIAQIELL